MENFHGRDVGEHGIGDITLVGDHQGIHAASTDDRVRSGEIRVVRCHQDAGRCRGVDGKPSGRLGHGAVPVAEKDGLEIEVAVGGVLSESHIAGTRDLEDLDAGLVGEEVVTDIALVDEEKRVCPGGSGEGVGCRKIGIVDVQEDAGAVGTVDREGAGGLA